MDDQRHRQLSGLRERIARGQYDVDALAVANAIVRRAQELVAPLAEPLAVAAAAGETQSTCSYPESSPPAFENVTPGGPSRTVPTHVKPVPLSQRRLSASARA